jgi:hypothetical protein
MEEQEKKMKPMNILFAGLLFVATIISASGWYGNLVLDYSHLNATEKINTTDLGHGEILSQVNETQSGMESGLRSGAEQIPILGGVLVQVFSAIQMLRAFFLSLWDALTVGSMLITGLDEIIPWAIHPTILSIIQMSLILLFVGSLVYLWLGRRPD